jgi:hypothetical protein
MKKLVVLVVCGAGIDPSTDPSSMKVFGIQLIAQMSVDIVGKLKEHE